MKRYTSMIYLIISKSGSTVQLFPSKATGNQLLKIKFETWRIGCSWNSVLVIRTHGLLRE